MHGTFDTLLLCNVEVPGWVPLKYTAVHVFIGLVESLKSHTPSFLYAGMHRDRVYESE